MMKLPESVYKAPVVFLLGMPMSGKSKMGKALAREKQCEFLDTDVAIEQEQNASIQEIFKFKGENYFRGLEKDWIENFKPQNPVVVATGGGMPCFFDNMTLFNKKGLTVYLNIPLGMIIQRAALSVNRPLFENKSPEELKEFIQQLYNKRHPIYMQSQVILSPGEPAEKTGQI